MPLGTPTLVGSRLLIHGVIPLFLVAYLITPRMHQSCSLAQQPDNLRYKTSEIGRLMTIQRPGGYIVSFSSPTAANAIHAALYFPPSVIPAGVLEPVGVMPAYTHKTPTPRDVTKPTSRPQVAPHQRAEKHLLRTDFLQVKPAPGARSIA
jgi:hypothetical protein